MKKIIAIAAVVALVAMSGTAYAADVFVTNTNSATISNTLGASSSSGGNALAGGAGVNSTIGGNVTNSNYANHAGNGASTVVGGHGGEIRTGNATALAEVSNEVNLNDVGVTLTPWSSTFVSVVGTNAIALGNVLGATSDTGNSAGIGGIATNSTVGGNVDMANASNVAGNMGGNVTGGNGGLIVTGHGASQTTAINILNRNITRIQN